MDFERMSREELLQVLEQLLAASKSVPPKPDEQRLLHDLQVHQIELEMQNRELREARAALEESRNRYADLYDFAPVAYLTFNEQGLVEELNLTAATLFGCSREYARGRPFIGLVQLEDSKRFFRHIGECAATQKPVVSEFRLTAQGRTVDVEMVSVPVIGIDRRPRSFRSALSDVTRRNLAEAQSQKAQEELRAALAWRENLLAMVSHDLKSPLNAISLSAVSMVPDEPTQERRSSRRQVDLIRRSADYMNHMINDLLLESLVVAGTFELERAEVTAGALLEEACRMCEPLAEARNLHLERRSDAGLTVLNVDRERVLRVFFNLIGNAAKFSPNGAAITVSAAKAADSVSFSVRDVGPGIAEDVRSHLFERYWRGEKGPRGLGLGLYIAKVIVDAHGGKLWVDSKPGEGSVFSFSLPCQG